MRSILLEAQPLLVNGVHSTWNGRGTDYWKFIVKLSDGTEGEVNKKSQYPKWYINEEHEYQKQEDGYCHNKTKITGLKKVEQFHQDTVQQSAYTPPVNNTQHSVQQVPKKQNTYVRDVKTNYSIIAQSSIKHAIETIALLPDTERIQRVNEMIQNKTISATIEAFSRNYANLAIQIANELDK